jgi:hypothetical protein
MKVRYFKFDSVEQLSKAKQHLEKSYPDITVLDKPTDLTLVVEMRNSLIFDDIRIAPIMFNYGGSLIEETPTMQDNS